MAELHPQKSGKTGILNVRIHAALRLRLKQISERYGPSFATQVEDALEALADLVEREGRYQRPLRMVFADRATMPLGMAAEDAPAQQAAATAAIQRLRAGGRATPEKPPAAHK